MKCDNCESLYINGIFTHERGCPTSYIGSLRECNWCGLKFEPEDQHSRFCSESCYAVYHNLDYDEDTGEIYP